MSKSSNSSKKHADNILKDILTRFFVVLIINVFSSIVLCLYFYLSGRDIYSGFIISIIALTTAAFLSAYYIGRKFRKNGLLYGVAFNLPVICIYVAVSLILNGFSYDSRLFIMLLTNLASSALGGITSVNSKTKYKRK